MTTATEIKLPIAYHSGQYKLFSDPAKVKIVAKGRRWGYTKGCANHVIEKMVEGISPVLWVDTVNGNIDRYVDRYFIPVLMKLPSQHWTWRQQKKELTILDRKCDFRSADQPERIEGFAYKLIILNEAGIILNDPYLWENVIRPMTIEYNPDQLIGGTPKGKNLFFDLKQKAEDRQDPRYTNWAFFKFTSYDNPYLDRKEIDALVADLPAHVREQEIFAEFLEDAYGVFRNIEACKGAELAKPSPDRQYYAGVDLAKHVDFTVITVLDDLGNQVYWNRLNKLDWVYQKKLITEVMQEYDARLFIDSTGVGDPIFDDLQRSGLMIEGYKFTAQSKRALIESLMISFEQAKIKILNEQVQLNELKNFGYEMKASGISYSAPEGKHDDCVIGLALANWARENAAKITPQVFVLGGLDEEPSLEERFERESKRAQPTDQDPPEWKEWTTEAFAVRFLAYMQMGGMVGAAKRLGVDQTKLRMWSGVNQAWLNMMRQSRAGQVEKVINE